MLKIPKCDIITKTEKRTPEACNEQCTRIFGSKKKKIPSFTSLISTDLQRNSNLQA